MQHCGCVLQSNVWSCGVEDRALLLPLAIPRAHVARFANRHLRMRCSGGCWETNTVSCTGFTSASVTTASNSRSCMLHPAALDVDAGLLLHHLDEPGRQLLVYVRIDVEQLEVVETPHSLDVHAELAVGVAGHLVAADDASRAAAAPRHSHHIVSQLNATHENIPPPDRKCSECFLQPALAPLGWIPNPFGTGTRE